MKLEPVWLGAISDLFINFSAGWLGAAFIVPNFSEKKGWLKMAVLTFDLSASILFLVVAVKLRRFL